MSFLWKTRRRTLDLSERGAVMGVLNVTPDSFSDGGQFLDVERAVARGLEMVAQGAAVIDIGGESTRPGALPVEETEQIRRTRPVIAALRQRTDALISIDTTRAGVAAAALEAGADIVNDISGLRGDPAMAGLCARTGAGVVIMHMQGQPRTMQAAPAYEDVVAEVSAFFRERLAEAGAAGIEREALVFDPGIGFGKTVAHNSALIRHLDVLGAVVERPLLLGVSRKSFLGKVLASDSMKDRAWGTVALTSLGREKGARLFRVHEVRPNAHALHLTEAILAAGSAPHSGEKPAPAPLLPNKTPPDS